MGCPPVRGDIPQALASVLSYVQMDNHGITIYTIYISVDLAYHEILRAQVGKGGIKSYFPALKSILLGCHRDLFLDFFYDIDKHLLSLTRLFADDSSLFLFCSTYF